MQLALKAIHIFALSFWFSTIAFFSFFTALPIIRGMEALAESKPEWLPGLQEKSQGTRLAGEALNPVFARYFPLQAACGVTALLTSLVCFGPRRSMFHSAVITFALLLVLSNLLVVAPRVHDLRSQRYDPDAEIAQKAAEDFRVWHGLSLSLDLSTLGFVGCSLLLTIALFSGKSVQTCSGHSPEKTSTAGPVMYT